MMIMKMADENDSDCNANTQLIHDFRDQIRTFSDEVINRLQDDYDFYKNSVSHFTKNLQLVQNQEGSQKQCFHLQNTLIFLRRKVERKKEDELA